VNFLIRVSNGVVLWVVWHIASECGDPATPGQLQKQIQNFKWKSVCGQPQPSSNANSNGRASAGKTKTKESAAPGTVIAS